MKKRIYSLLVIILAIGLTACGKPEAAVQEKAAKAEDKEEIKSKDYRDGIIHGSELILHNGVAFWGYEGQLCSALLDEKDDLYDFVSEGELGSKISGIAINGSFMYMTTADGLLRLSLEEAEQGQSVPKVLDDHSFSNDDFEMYDGNIYFTYGRYLYRVPEQGGESKKLEEGIECFQVSSEGIYCLNEDGDLLLLSLDGTERKTLHELGCTGGIFFCGDLAYIMTGKEDDFVYEYAPETNDVKELRLENTLSPYYEIWATGECIYYEAEDFNIYRHDLDTGEEALVEAEYDLPDHSCGYLEDSTIYYVYSDYLYWMHLDGGGSFRMHKNEVLEGSSSVSQSARPGKDAAADKGTAGGYNIAEGLTVSNSEGQARLESEYFTLYLPADGDWAYRVVDDTTFEIYYEPAYEAGFGGNLVTIGAFDWGDNSYEDDPSYTIAGLGENKKYVAFFPTDVQFDVRQAEGYTRMSEYVRRIDSSEEAAKDNPFSCQ